MFDPEVGFTSDVIRDPTRFVGRHDVIRDCIKALNTPLGLIGVYGRRGVGKSSLLRQIQQMALGDYTLARRAGLENRIPRHPRKYLTVYYSCDSMIENGIDLLKRLCNDQSEEDGLLRLVPNDGKELIEFERSAEVNGSVDLKVVNWGGKGIASSKYARVVPDDIVQTFRNFVSAIVTHQVKSRMNRDAILIILDEFDVIKDKSGIGSLIKSLSSSDVKFAICGIGKDLIELVADHNSVERLLEEGSIQVKPMSLNESKDIMYTAERLYHNRIFFEESIKDQIAMHSEGYPYFVQLIGKECISQINYTESIQVDEHIFERVLADIKIGQAFPTLEAAYQRAVGTSNDRQFLLHMLAEQNHELTLFNESVGRVVLRYARREAQDVEIQYVDQLIPRLVDSKYGPTLTRISDKQGEYEFVNPIFRLYVRLRRMS